MTKTTERTHFASLWEPRELAPTEAAYIAGFLDGEGSITLSRSLRFRKNRSGRKYSPQVSFANTDLDVLVWIRERLGLGHITQKMYNREGHRPLYRLRLSCRQSQLALTQLAPYLLIKRKQAVTINEYFEKVKPCGRQSQAMNEFLDSLWLRMRKLNSRGEITEDDQGKAEFRLSPDPGRCSVDECERRAAGRGLCMMHWKRERKQQLKAGSWKPRGKGGRKAKM